jgi:hypothetical protein
MAKFTLSIRDLQGTATIDHGRVQLRAERGYAIRDEDGHRSITCLVCGWTSHNPNDVRERYCGHCHAFHDDPVV